MDINGSLRVGTRAIDYDVGDFARLDETHVRAYRRNILPRVYRHRRYSKRARARARQIRRHIATLCIPEGA